MRDMWIAWIAAGVLAASIGTAQAEVGVAWEVRPDFKNDEAAEELSGAVCAGAQDRRRWCYAVNDEKKYVQTFAVEDGLLAPGARLRVLEKRDVDGVKFDEPDLEAAAYADGYVYLVGSHGLSRKSAKRQRSRYFVFRFPTDPVTGAPTFKPTRDAVDAAIERSDALTAVIEASRRLAPFTTRRLDDNGANIEGAGVLGADLFVGFRAPVLAEGAVVLRIPIAEVFGAEDGGRGATSAQEHVLNLGAGYGVRDMARFGEGFLILAGPGGEAAAPPAIWRWTPGAAPRRLMILEVPPGRKAEGLLVLGETSAGAPRVLVLFDGVRNGAPTAFTSPG